MKKIIIAAVTVDGKVSDSPTGAVDWTSKEDKQFFRDETKKAGVVIFGSNTYRTIGRAMPDRLNIIMTRNPHVYKDKEISGLLEFTDAKPQTILESLKNRGFESVVIGGGSAIYSLFFELGLVDELCITICPRIFGKGVPFLKDMKISATPLYLNSVEMLGKQEVLLKYTL